MPVVKKITCSKCGAVFSPEKYYVSKNVKNEYYRKIQICKNCLQELFVQIFSKSQDRKEAVTEFCVLVDIPFSESIYDMSVNAFATRGETEEYKLATTYLSFINSNVGKSAGEKFSDSENFNRIFNEGGGFDSNVQFKLDRAEEEIISLTEHIKDLELEKASISKEISILKPENLKLQTRLTASETEVASLKISNEQELARKEGLKIKLESDIARLSSELDIAKRNLADTSKRLKEKTEECDTLQKTVNSFNKQTIVLENDATDANRNLEKYKLQKETELSELSDKYEEDTKKLKNRVAELLIQLEDEKNSKKVIEPELGTEEIPKEYIKEWGEGLSLEDYEFMNDEIADWKDKHEITKKAEDLLLHKIVRLELKIRNIEKVDGDTSDELKALQSLIKTANFVERKSINEKSPQGNKILGLVWKDIETYEPSEWYENQKKFRDADDMDAYLKKYVTRPIKNFVTGSRDFDPSIKLSEGDV